MVLSDLVFFSWLLMHAELTLKNSLSQCASATIIRSGALITVLKPVHSLLLKRLSLAACYCSLDIIKFLLNKETCTSLFVGPMAYPDLVIRFTMSDLGIEYYCRKW
jgi:hypothetical protein